MEKDKEMGRRRNRRGRGGGGSPNELRPIFQGGNEDQESWRRCTGVQTRKGTERVETISWKGRYSLSIAGWLIVIKEMDLVKGEEMADVQ